MTTTSRPTRRLALGATAVALALTPLTARGPAQAATTGLPSGAALTLEDVRAAGLPADTGTVDLTGDALLGDAGRFDDGCLGEKSIRNMTNAKPYPAPSAALGFVDVTWSSTQDKEVWVREGITQAPDLTRAKRYVENVTRAVESVKACQDDPAFGPDYRPGRTFRVGAAEVTTWLDETATGRTDGGGTAVVRRGTRVAVVGLLAGATSSDATLRALATAAAHRLG